MGRFAISSFVRSCGHKSSRGAAWIAEVQSASIKIHADVYIHSLNVAQGYNETFRYQRTDIDHTCLVAWLGLADLVRRASFKNTRAQLVTEIGYTGSHASCAGKRWRDWRIGVGPKRAKPPPLSL